MIDFECRNFFMHYKEVVVEGMEDGAAIELELKAETLETGQCAEGDIWKIFISGEYTKTGKPAVFIFDAMECGRDSALKFVYRGYGEYNQMNWVGAV